MIHLQKPDRQRAPKTEKGFFFLQSNYTAVKAKSTEKKNPPQLFIINQILLGQIFVYGLQRKMTASVRRHRSWREDSSIRKSMSKYTNVAFDGLSSNPRERRMRKEKTHSGENWGGGRIDGRVRHLLIYSISQIDFPFKRRRRGGCSHYPDWILR